MNRQNSSYWFRAKKYGWGWGLPARWEGWVVLVGWLLIFILGGIFIAPRSITIYIVFAVLLSLLLVVICYAKGEPPRWRWGKS